jgi:hypothetical protein
MVRVLASFLLRITRNVNMLAPLTSIAETPQFVGQIAIAGGAVYIATGTTDVNDWTEMAEV